MMSELRYLPMCAGIYFAIEEGGTVIYIGQSKNIRHRWRGHNVQGDLCGLTNLEAARRVRLAWLAVESGQGLDEMERVFIRRFRPRLNQVHNDKPQKEAKAKPARKRVPLPRKPGGLLSPRQYAEQIGKPYTTVMTWLQTQQMPDAVKIETPTGHSWAIPEGAKPPETKVGRPSKSATTATSAVKPATKRATKKAGN